MREDKTVDGPGSIGFSRRSLLSGAAAAGAAGTFGFSALMPVDKALAEQVEALKADVLSVGHHGSATSTSWDFLQAAVPEFAVISCGAGNMYGHPHADTMEKLSDMGIQVYRSDEQGTIVASSDGSAITWSADPCNDYTSGDGETAGQSEGEKGFTAEDNCGTDAAAASEKSEQIAAADDSQEEMVWISATGSKYHSIPDCGNMNPDKAYQEQVSQAEAQGYEACKKCF